MEYDYRRFFIIVNCHACDNNNRVHRVSCELSMS